MGAPEPVAITLSVLIPGLLRSYTNGAAQVELALGARGGADAVCVGDALDALDERFPGMRFRIVDERNRIRPHIKLFVDREQARDLGAVLPAAATLMIVGALSGG